jgi:hypothetical protein
MGTFWDPMSSNKMVRDQGNIVMNFEREDLDLGKKGKHLRKGWKKSSE